MGSNGPETMPARAVFQEVMDRYLDAYRAGDAPGCAALYAEDGALHSPFGPPATGRSAIAALHRDWFEEAESGKTMVVTRAGIDGDLGFCLVDFEADVPGADGAVTRARGTALNVMERRTDGVWTFKLTSLNELGKQGMDSDR